ncbi:signal peptide peptidase SppA [Mucilaginibacter arboris]|uniref:Signal peptide peptidase SppA n=1 Tax=Mucilaginibacter arboris TaxID=2682090 RepID=A0A7K1SZ29_9SPHI|nr:signal peptide peptidase SppA [Mucilaginibacter arboris]MVN22300.1 signal peptide peptidase SppA [Mucilaginibacter arboris]
MKQFFKYVFATIIGVLLCLVIFTFVVIGIISSAGKDKKTEVEANSVLRISLDYAIKERTSANPLSGIPFLNLSVKKSLGLNDILANIKRAKTDSNIKGIYLDESYMLSGEATIEEIRNALIDFKKSGKFIISYGEIYTQGAYYLASVADKVYINPKGIFEFRGFHSQYTFFKGALEKLGIEAQVIKVGTFKSAVEPFILDKMSDANRLQVNSYLGSLYDYFLTGIGKSRNLNKDSLFNIANNLRIKYPEDALKYKLVDGLKYKDEILDELKKRTGKEQDENINLVEMNDYNDPDQNKDSGSSNSRIAIIYASGDIGSGEGDDNSIGSEGISKAIRKARLDKKVKAVVLRINSPGGSSLASDVLWREVVMTKKVKPIIVSMGDVAASGGYYMACAADSIFAQPNTITGSIGIFAILPNMQTFLNQKLGITFDGVKTGKFADLGDVTRPLNPEERMILQDQVNRGYLDFTNAVASGRKKTQKYIDSIGQGRVWTGSQALKIGLVDRLGNLDDAIHSAAAKAKITDYKLVAYPEQKTLLENFGSGLTSEVKTYMMKQELGESYRYYNDLKTILKFSGTQMRLPYTLDIR